MTPCKRKFVFTKALYIMLWVLFGLSCFSIFVFTMANLEDEEWHPIGLLYDGWLMDYLKTIIFLLLALSFKKEKDLE